MDLIQGHSGKKNRRVSLARQPVSRAASVNEIKASVSLLSGSRIFEFPRRCQTSVLAVPCMQACDE